MDQIISELITQWGTFGLIIALTAYTVYNNFIEGRKKDKGKAFECHKGEIIGESIKGMKELMIEKIDHMSENMQDLNTKVDHMHDNFGHRIDSIETKILELPDRNIEASQQQNLNIKIIHDKRMADLFKLGPQLHKIMAIYNERIGADHIFLGSFHNGNSSLSGIPYYKFDIIAEKFKPNKVERDCEFAHMYKDADILRYDALPISLVQNGVLHFVIDDQKKSELSKYDDIIFRRMIGRDIKQIALCLLKDINNRPSGFIGCVSYDYEKLNIDELINCSKELEVIYHSSEEKNK